MILKDLISYRDSIINLETELVRFEIKDKMVKIIFNILLLGRDKVVLRMF